MGEGGEVCWCLGPSRGLGGCCVRGACACELTYVLGDGAPRVGRSGRCGSLWGCCDTPGHCQLGRWQCWPDAQERGWGLGRESHHGGGVFEAMGKNVILLDGSIDGMKREVSRTPTLWGKEGRGREGVSRPVVGGSGEGPSAVAHTATSGPGPHKHACNVLR